MDNSRAKSPNIGNVLNAQRLARRKVQRSARRDRNKVEIEKKVNFNDEKIYIVSFVYRISILSDWSTERNNLKQALVTYVDIIGVSHVQIHVQVNFTVIVREILNTFIWKIIRVHYKNLKYIYQ